jgi:RNA polymerase sigma factor (sigma-70 family)
VTTDLTDADLWERATTGESAAFGEIFDRHSRAIYNHCFRKTSSWSTAEDLTSVVFLETWRRRETVRLHDDSALPWLFGVANNVVRGHRRSARRYLGAISRMSPPDPVPDHADSVIDDLRDEQRMTEVRTAMSQMRRVDREVFELCVWAGLNHVQAAAALGVAVGTVKSRLARARGRLRQDISGAAN